ncbi:MAG: hypothetical protein WA797_10730 [Acidimicrobiales bacterium]
MSDISLTDPGWEDAPGAVGTSLPSLENIHWQLSYDRESVERFATEVEEARTRLEAEIADTKLRLAHARKAKAARQPEVTAELGDLVLAAQRELVEMERSHQEIIDSIRTAADLEVQRLLDAAHLEVAQVHESSSRWQLDQ